jgi:ribonuclease HI
VTIYRFQEFSNLLVNSKSQEFSIYTDGSSWPNPGPGGCASVCYQKGNSDPVAIYLNYEVNSTNNRMEIAALSLAIEMAKTLDLTSTINIYSDSQYVIGAITKWRPTWESNGFKTSGGQLVKNREEWEFLFSLIDSHPLPLNLFWVKGHSTDQCNAAADTWAAYARTLGAQVDNK